MPLGLPSILKIDGSDLSEEEIISILQRDAKAGHLAWDPAMRFLAWSLFLGVLEQGSEGGSLGWGKCFRAQRQRYTELKRRAMPDLFQVASKADPLLGTSLDGANSNPWETYYENNELLSQIRVDLDRLFLTGTLVPEDYFQDAAKRQILQTILFVYAQTYPDIAYKQGMHEVLAFVTIVVELSRNVPSDLTKSEEPTPLEKELLDQNAGEADCFCLFERIMQPLQVLYGPGGVSSCDRMQYDLLGRLDGQLREHLEECRVVPQIYGLRWLRLLFTREFPSQEVLVIWDSVFALSCGDDSVGLVKQLEYVGLAMLMMSRVDLLHGSENEVLQLLMRYTLKGKVSDLVELSQNLQDFPSPQAINSPRHSPERISLQSSYYTSAHSSPLETEEKRSRKAPSWMLGNSKSNGRFRVNNHFDNSASSISSDSEKEPNGIMKFGDGLHQVENIVGEKLHAVGNSVKHVVDSLGHAAQRVVEQISSPHPETASPSAQGLSCTDAHKLSVALNDALKTLNDGLNRLPSPIPHQISQAMSVVKNVSCALESAAGSRSRTTSNTSSKYCAPIETEIAGGQQLFEPKHISHTQNDVVMEDSEQLFQEKKKSQQISPRRLAPYHQNSNILTLFDELEENHGSNHTQQQNLTSENTQASILHDNTKTISNFQTSVLFENSTPPDLFSTAFSSPDQSRPPSTKNSLFSQETNLFDDSSW